MENLFTAKSLDDAKNQAATEFNASVEEITFEIIEEPKKSLFGKAKGDYVVKASYEASKKQIAINYITKVLTKMEIGEFSLASTDEENGVNIDITAENPASIIGKNGDAIDSLQYLASLVSNRADREFFRVSIDCDNYRAKRLEKLLYIAEKMANNVKKTGRSSALEPMNPYERRIVHAKVSEIEGVVSRSAGQDPYRKVIIHSTNPRPQKPVNDFKKKRRPAPAKKFDITTSFEKDYKKPKPEDSIGSGLYSKIEF